ncbi:MAG: sigma-54-dependent Fis family transcriptional regulator [Chthoniobacterales bacterium]|nr:sigma-54-dependent Fis family transcriptional regulator [Chthoniobacterales bacterium]
MPMSAKQTVLVVDPDPDFLEWACTQLATDDVRVVTADAHEQAFKIFCAEDPLVVITEMRLGTHSGLELLARLRKRNPNVLVIVTGALGTTQSVIESMRLGAFDFVRKEQLPFNLKIVVDAALKAAAEARQARPSEPSLTVEQHQDSIVGQSAAMQEVFKMVGRISNSDAAVMITGESGSGKELVARAIHQYSARHERPFLAINCAAIPENLLESELFGHEKGSFTGASAQRIGRFEQCDGGTLFLDEIGDMPLAIQSKLLRVLQDGTFSRVGGNQTLKTDVRIVAATNKNLEAEVADKKFREDLFYRLNVVRLHLPPLRNRKEDIRLLAEYFLKRIASRTLKPQLQLSREAVEVLEAYGWPGNVRELENTVQRAAVLATGDVLLPKDLPLGQPAESAVSDSAAPRSPATIDEAVTALFEAATARPGLELLPWLEREFTKRAMEATGQNQVRAAKLLGITRATLRKRLEHLRAGAA